MNQNVRTAVFVLCALALAATTFLAVPRRKSPAEFDDQGRPFYDEEFDPRECTFVEVSGYDADKGGTRVFRVELKDNRWTIPSHEDYPADAKEQLAKTAGIVNGLKKGVFYSNRARDHASFGVVDPRDESNLSPEGRGKRIMLKNRSGKVLTDLIIGDAVEGASGSHYVRRGDSNRVYAARVEASSISTRFADWVETNLLKLKKADVRRMELDAYKVDRRVYTLVPGQVLALARDDDDKWVFRGKLDEKEELDTSKVDAIADTLEKLTLVGVRLKPSGVMAALEKANKGQQIDQLEAFKLQTMQTIGFYLVRDQETKGLRVVGNEGEARVFCKDGVTCTLRFGEVLYGEPDEVSGGPAGEGKDSEDEGKKEEEEGAEHRYCFITAGFDEALLGEKPKAPEKAKEPDRGKAAEENAGKDDAKKDEDDAGKAYEKAKKQYEDDLKAFEKKVNESRERVRELQQRFADWYYVISADAFKKMRLSRDDIIKAKKEEKKEDDKKNDTAGDDAKAAETKEAK